MSECLLIVERSEATVNDELRDWEVGRGNGRMDGKV